MINLFVAIILFILALATGDRGLFLGVLTALASTPLTSTR